MKKKEIKLGSIREGRSPASPGFRSPWSSRSLYATHSSRCIAAYSRGIRSVGILMRSFSRTAAIDAHAPNPDPGLWGTTQSPSLSCLTPAPVLSTVAIMVDPATNGGRRMASVVAA